MVSTRQRLQQRRNRQRAYFRRGRRLALRRSLRRRDRANPNRQLGRDIENLILSFVPAASHADLNAAIQRLIRRRIFYRR